MSYETDCKERIARWEKQLIDGDVKILEALKTAVETQLALAELRIKVRQADHAKVWTWAPLVLSFIGGILTALLGAWLKH